MALSAFYGQIQFSENCSSIINWLSSRARALCDRIDSTRLQNVKCEKQSIIDAPIALAHVRLGYRDYTLRTHTVRAYVLRFIIRMGLYYAIVRIALYLSVSAYFSEYVWIIHFNCHSINSLGERNRLKILAHALGEHNALESSMNEWTDGVCAVCARVVPFWSRYAYGNAQCTSKTSCSQTLHIFFVRIFVFRDRHLCATDRDAAFAFVKRATRFFLVRTCWPQMARCDDWFSMTDITEPRAII